MGLQLRDLIHHGIGHHVEAKEEVVFVITEKGDVFQNEGIVRLRINHALASCGIEANGLMVCDAVGESLDLL